jgi:hypothetical protein
MKKQSLLIGMALLILAAACTPAQLGGLQTLAAVVPEREGPLGGRIAALPTANLATPTPPPSSISFPTPAPTVVGPLATLTAIAGLLPTIDLSATPYAIVLQGRPHFIEFRAGW